MIMRKCYFQNSRNGVAAREENSGERPGRRPAENDKAQQIRDPTNRLLRLLSKSQCPSVTITTVEQYKRKTLSKQPKHHSP
jgi:hypothetical protein